MLENEAEYIKYYSIIVKEVLSQDFLADDTTIAAELALIDKVSSYNPKLSEQIKLYLNIAMYLVADSSDKGRYKNYFRLHRKRKEPFKTPVVIVAGGASRMDETKTDKYLEYIRELMQGFSGTIISGGTTAGIPGLVGQVKAEMQKQTPVDFDLLAYLPEYLPKEAAKSTAYDHFYETACDHFSVIEVLSYWCDLVDNGIHPKDVILVGIEGGVIASMEYRIALSLGAKVALVANSGRAVDNLLQDETWKNHRNLMVLEF